MTCDRGEVKDYGGGRFGFRIPDEPRGGLNFAQAMQIVLDGGRVRRKEWHRPAYIRRAKFDRAALATSSMEDKAGEMIMLVMRLGQIGPYPPSHCDMLATDWYEVLQEIK